MDLESQQRWERRSELRRKLGERFHAILAAVEEIAQETVRASSVVENLDSHLRCYFFLRRHAEAIELARRFCAA